jgi:hypothetical protein
MVEVEPNTNKPQRRRHGARVRSPPMPPPRWGEGVAPPPTPQYTPHVSPEASEESRPRSRRRHLRHIHTVGRNAELITKLPIGVKLVDFFLEIESFLFLTESERLWKNLQKPKV